MGEKREIRSLTGLRGLASVLVVAFHYAFLPFQGQPSVRNPVDPGYLAVDLFFILSGFVMAATYGDSFAGTWSLGTYLKFLERRFARVYPLYLAATLCAFLLTKLHIMPGTYHPTRALATNVFALQNFGPGLVDRDFGISLNVPCWSISTEAFAYLLFPWLSATVLFRSWQATLAATASALAALVVIVALPIPWKDGAGGQGFLDVATGLTLWPLVRCLAGFTLGLVVFRVTRKPRHLRRGDLAWIDMGVVAALLVTWLFPGADALIVALSAVLVWQVCDDQSPLAHLLGRPLPRLLGELSYALYLIHFLVGESLVPGMHSVLQAAGVPQAWMVSLVLAFALSLALSWAAYNYLEKPARDFLRRSFELRRSPISEEPAAP